jgi:hypothetical protein
MRFYVGMIPFPPRNKHICTHTHTSDPSVQKCGVYSPMDGVNNKGHTKLCTVHMVACRQRNDGLYLEKRCRRRHATWSLSDDGCQDGPYGAIQYRCMEHGLCRDDPHVHGD